MRISRSRWLAALLAVGLVVGCLVLAVGSRPSPNRGNGSLRPTQQSRSAPSRKPTPLAMQPEHGLHADDSPDVVEALYRWTLREADARALDAIDATPTERVRATEIAAWYDAAQAELARSLLSGQVPGDEWFDELEALGEERRARERALFGISRSERLHQERDAVLNDAIDGFVRPAAQESLDQLGIPSGLLEPDQEDVSL